jgi:formylglycine-generating enzyme required for sulfatase activity
MQAEGEGTAFTLEQVLANLKDEQVLYHARSASLLAGGEQIRFTHQLLQEYFAAHRLQEMMKNTKAEALFPKEKWWEPQGWEETLILLAGLYSDDCTPVVEWLKNAQPEVAARCIVESGAHCPDETLTRLRENWIPRLTDLKNDPSPKARAAVGRALGRLQLDGEPLDNRKGVSIISVDGITLPDIDWMEIPAGKFTYQEKEQRDEGLFFIARYPVTFAQFQTFLDDPRGFVNPRWWEGLSADDEHKHAPGEQWFKFYNHPRDDVSWYDAVAFCRWLTEKIRTYPQLLPQKMAGMKGCEIQLPTEWQWEKAARGTDGREYPYKGKFDNGKANTSATGIGQTSTVGIFPQGASPYGVLEMSGNVWEWCLNEHSNPEKIEVSGDDPRVVRGGSWNHIQGFARASIRSNNGPDRRYNYYGFRVVVRPPSL